MKSLRHHEQLNLFNQPIEVLVEAGCTVKRAAKLIERTDNCIYRQLHQNKLYQRRVSTGTWRVYLVEKTDAQMRVKVTFVFSPQEKNWQIAQLV